MAATAERVDAHALAQRVAALAAEGQVIGLCQGRTSQPPSFVDFCRQRAAG